MKRIIGGPRAVEEALRGHPQQISAIYFTAELERNYSELLNQARKYKIRAEPLPRPELDEIAAKVRHQGIIAIGGDYPYISLEQLLADAGPCPLLVALDQIQDPRNLGAIVRSAVALGADGVVTLKDRASPVTPITVRASAGATERAKICRVTNLARTLASLQNDNFEIVGLAGEGTVELCDLPYPPRGRVLVVGSEGSGLRPLVRKHCDLLARIHLPGPISSLNASVAAAIAIYESNRSRPRDQQDAPQDSPPNPC